MRELQSESAAQSEKSTATTRLSEVDALRGIAAMAVVLFHMTTRYNELFQPGQHAAWSMPHGHFGVNLFFIISGFVIFMTLERTRRPMDFVVSRFSRLFPAYWAAIPLTFAVTHLLALPIKTVTLPEALGNGLMLHGFLGIPHVDGVYWTLEVELMFYIGMFTLFFAGQMGRLVEALLLALTLRLAYVLLARHAGIELSWTLSRFLILQFLPWFALGIAIFKTVSSSTVTHLRWRVLAAAAIATLAIANSWLHAALGIGLGALVWGAASGRIRLLRHPLLVWLGAISYPLYLLHENIGWAVLHQLTQAGMPIDIATLLAIAAALSLATTLHKVVEQPAMHALREAYRARKSA